MEVQGHQLAAGKIVNGLRFGAAGTVVTFVDRKKAGPDCDADERCARTEPNEVESDKRGDVSDTYEDDEVLVARSSQACRRR